VISVAAKLVSMHPQTLRYYERLGLVVPSRSRGKVRLYSPRDIERLQRIARLVNELGVNLAGVEVILNMSERMEEMQREMEAMRAALEAEVQRLRRLVDERSRNLPTVLRGQLPSGRLAGERNEEEL
jgi:MerR family transcriptional regulator/heat shock protein HspR